LPTGGESKDFLEKRAERWTSIPYDSRNFRSSSGICSAKRATRSAPPSARWDPLLLARLLELNDVQEGVLNICLRVADDNGLLLLDLKDLRAMLNHVGENADPQATFGNVSSASRRRHPARSAGAGAAGRRAFVRRAGAEDLRT
jgi:DNA helicase HerA-like ATPase